MLTLRIRCIWLLSIALALAPSAARAGCNLIAVSALEAPSTGFPSSGPSTTTRVNGYVNRPIAGPGDTVTLRADLGCLPGNPGFALPGSADPNLVRLRFHSPSAGAGFPVNEVTVPAGDVSPTRCGNTRCKALQFTMPDTGFTGPAEILVQRTIGGSPQVVARVFELYQTTRSCDPLAWQPEARFGTFTVLPPRTDLVEGTTPNFVGAVDGYGNLLVPLGFRDVLQANAGAPIATILNVVSANAALLNALGDSASASDDLRTYNVFGRPIPPVMRLVKDPLPMTPPAFIGTTDVLESVLQVLPLGAPPLEYAELMAGGTGAVTLFDAEVAVQSAAPLRALRTSLEALAVGVDEDLRGDRNLDGDTTDLVVEITQVQTGLVTDTEQAVAQTTAAPKAALATSGGNVAYLESEQGDRIDRNQDGDVGDSVLRVFDSGGSEITTGIPAAADTAGLLPGASPVALSGNYAFLLRSEPAEASVAPLRASVDSVGSEGDGDSSDAAPSADGRYVAFTSGASNLVFGDANGALDVFVRDLQSGTTERVSVGVSEGNAASVFPAISADGRFVVFQSLASSLVFGDTNGSLDVFVYDRQDFTTERVSVGVFGEGDGHSLIASISADGRYVAFSSYASNLVFGDTNGTCDIFVRDRLLGITERASVDGSESEANGCSDTPWISANGRYVAFASLASNLVPGDTNGSWDIFVRDRQSGDTQRVSVSSAGGQGNDSAAFYPGLSADGRFVVFTSIATNLVPGDTNGWEDAFVHDRQTGATERVSVDSFGAQGNGSSATGRQAISGDGRFVTLASFASNLVPDDTNSNLDVFVRDRQTDTTKRVSVDGSGNQANANSILWPSISSDGRVVAFHSDASNLVVGDGNAVRDVFVAVPACRPRPLLPADWCDFDADGDLEDAVLQAVDTLTGNVVSSGRATGQAVVAEGRALFVADDRGVSLFDPFTGTVSPLSLALTPIVAPPLALQWTLDAGGSGHFYRGIQSIGISWADANTAAQAAGGHLATITSAAESAFIHATLALNGNHDDQFWIGGFQPGGSLEPAGGWQWVTGEPWDYTNWAAVEPNDEFDENSLAFAFFGTWTLSDHWNDLPGGSFSVIGDGGYVVESVTGRPEVALSPGAVCALRDAGGGLGIVVVGSGPSVVDTGEVADAIAAVTTPAGSLCMFRAAAGHELRVVNVATPSVTGLGWTAEDFIVGAGTGLVAFRTRESLEGANPLCPSVVAGGCDLNGDGDALDLVMQVANVETGAVTNLERAAIPCTFDACDAFDLYRVRADSTVSFLGLETEQAVGFGCLATSSPGECDLDGNGLGSDMVVHVVKLAPDLGGTLVVRASQVLPAEPEATTPFFPDTQIDKTIVNVAKTECRAAQIACCSADAEDPICAIASFGTSFAYAPGSCASEYDTDPEDDPGQLDCETLRDWIVGDSDTAGGSDGILDVASNLVLDVCIDLANPTQEDADADALGDGAQTCDPDPGSDPPGALDCDLNGDAHIDRRDVDLIVEGVPSLAVNHPTPGWDRRDRNGDARITSFDTALCRAECTRVNCKIPGPCGLLGAEALLPLGIAAWLGRRRRSRSRDRARAQRAVRAAAVAALLGASALGGEPASALVLSLTPTSVVEQAGVPFDLDLTISGLGAPPWLRAVTVKLSFDATEVAFLGATPGADLGYPCAPFDPNPLCDASFTASATPAGVVTFVETSFLSDLSAQPSSFTLATFSFEGLPPPGISSASTISLVVDAFTELVVEDALGTPSLASFGAPLPTVDVTILPEPSTALLLAAGLLGLGARASRARRRTRGVRQQSVRRCCGASPLSH